MRSGAVCHAHMRPTDPSLAHPQATYSKETTERMLLLSYAHKAATPIIAAYAMVASYPYPCNVSATLAAIMRRLEPYESRRSSLQTTQ